MKQVPSLVLALAFALALAGCTATGGQDPWAYTKKELYSGGFDLARVGAAGSDSQVFRVTDGSIAALRVLVWVNATAGTGTVTISDPEGRSMLVTGGTADRQFPLALGEWSVLIEASPDAQGRVHLLVVRA